MVRKTSVLFCFPMASWHSPWSRLCCQFVFRFFWKDEAQWCSRTLQIKVDGSLVKHIFLIIRTTAQFDYEVNKNMDYKSTDTTWEPTFYCLTSASESSGHQNRFSLGSSNIINPTSISFLVLLCRFPVAITACRMFGTTSHGKHGTHLNMTCTERHKNVYSESFYSHRSWRISWALGHICVYITRTDPTEMRIHRFLYAPT